MIGCNCPVCTSDNPRNNRLRASVLVETSDTSILIDTTPELRIQALREGIKHVDAVLLTHAHADHLFGLDDVRRFNDIAGKSMPVYALEETLRTVRKVFEYVFIPTQIGGSKPSLELYEISGRFSVNGVDVVPVPVLHGKLNVLGYRIGGFAYVTDVSCIPESSMDLLKGLDVLVLGVLRPMPHETHFSLPEGLAVVEELKPGAAYFTHIAHRLEHEKTNASLPDNVRLAYDGLQIIV